jgi:hypothetical protein
VEIICDYIDYESDDPLKSFDDQELEHLRNLIIKVGQEFNFEFSQHCGGSNSSQYYEYINRSYFHEAPKDQCEHLNRSRDLVLKHAADLHSALLSLRNFERLI